MTSSGVLRGAERDGRRLGTHWGGRGWVRRACPPFGRGNERRVLEKEDVTRPISGTPLARV
jgi:hypothetical protein